MSTTKVAKPKMSNVKVNKMQPKNEEDYLGSINVAKFNYNVTNYTKLYLHLYGSVLNDYRFRKKKIGFLMEDGTFVKMKVRTAIINLIFWKPYCDFNRTITVDSLVDTKYMSESLIESKMNLIIDEFKPHITIEQMCKCLRHILESLACIPKDFCYIIGNTMGYRDILDLAKKNKEFFDILHTSYSDDTPIGEIEADIMVRTNRAKEIIENDIDCNLRPFFKAGGNINLGQLSQCLVSVGPRSDIYGNISPVIINTNFVRGLRNVSDYYLESYSCRKALIANKYQMSDSGYTSRQMDLLTVDSCLVDVEDCGTENTVDVFITDDKTLKMMNMKYIETGRNKDNKPILKEIKYSKDKHLIGTTVKMRSSICCGLEEGKICKKCYGELSYATLGYHTGIVASHSLSMPLSQTVLSTKHLNKTRSRKIIWSDKMLKFFVCETENVYLKPEYAAKSSIEIGFYAEDIEEYLNMWFDVGGEDEDEDSAGEDKNNMLLDYVTRFNLIIDGETVPFDNIDTDLYINQEFLSKIMKSNKIEEGIIYVSLTNQSPDMPVFDINIENMEIGVFLKRIMALLGIRSKSVYTTYENLIALLTAAIVEVGINVNFAHLESIMYNMIRDPNMIIHRPNFQESNPQYVIHGTSAAIMNARALTTSFAFERISQQLSNVFTYYKSSKGFLDPFFQ